MARTWGNRREWTRQEVEAVLACYREGLTHAEAGRRVGRTGAAVQRYVAKHRLVPDVHWDPADDALIRERYDAAPLETLARRLGRSPTAVRGRAYKLGLTAPALPTPYGLPRGLRPSGLRVLLTREEHDILVTFAGRVAERCGPGDGPTVMISPGRSGGHRVSVNTSSTRGGVACQTHHSFTPDGTGD